MPFSTYAQLQAAVLAFNWTRDTGSVTDFITLAQTRINIGLRVPFMDKTAALTISADRVLAPADMASPRRLWLDDSYDTPLSPTSPERLAYLRAAYGTDRPQWYAIEGDTTSGAENTTEGEYFVFAPDPGATTYAGKLLYTRRLAVLSGDSDTNIVLTRYPSLYLYGALWEAAAYADDDARVAKYMPMFQSMLADINTQGRSDGYAGGGLQPITAYTF